MRLAALWLCLSTAGCGLVLDLDPPDVRPDAARLDASMRDAGGRVDAGHDAGMSCRECEDGNPCTLDLCVGGSCTREFPDIACEFDDDACTLDHCVAGVCTPGGVMACPGEQDCVDGACACPDTSLRACGDECITANTCCDNSDCTLPEVCPGAGGQCACPFGQRPCGERCISAATGCCSHSDCGTVRQCVSDVCVCPAGTTECGIGGACVRDDLFCEPGDPPFADPTCGSSCLARPCLTNCQPASTCVLSPGAQCDSGLLGLNQCDPATSRCVTCVACLITLRSATVCVPGASCG